MFSWIRHYVGEVCALPNTLLVITVFIKSSNVSFPAICAQTFLVIKQCCQDISSRFKQQTPIFCQSFLAANLLWLKPTWLNPGQFFSLPPGKCWTNQSHMFVLSEHKSPAFLRLFWGHLTHIESRKQAAQCFGKQAENKPTYHNWWRDSDNSYFPWHEANTGV